MRGSGMDDVIFAGTATRPQRDFAEVGIHLDRAEPDGDGDTQAEVIRRIERGAGSAYRINSRDVRAKDVSLLFADAATGAHSPALVSQGRISAVISAKPAERRQMLEEAAGISGLHVRRKDAEQKLRAAETNLVRLDELIADMQVRAGALRRQARAAERYRQLSDEIRIAEARLIYARWRGCFRGGGSGQEGSHDCRRGGATGGRGPACGGCLSFGSGWIARRCARQGPPQAERDAESALSHRLAMLSSERAALDRRIVELNARRTTIGQDLDRESRLAIDAAEAIVQLEEDEKALSLGLSEAEARRGAVEVRVAEATELARAGELAPCAGARGGGDPSRRICGWPRQHWRPRVSGSTAHRPRFSG